MPANLQLPIDNSGEISILLTSSGLREEDPYLYQALQLINETLALIQRELHPVITAFISAAEISAALSPPASFTFSLPGLTTRLQWSAITDAAQYEIRRGTIWDTASFVVKTPSLQADIDPLLIGDHTFLIKSITSGGVYSSTATSLIVTIPVIPPVTITFQTIDNNVLLSWSTAITSYAIDYYDIMKDGVSFSKMKGNFVARFEAAAGSYEYTIIAYDIAGNASAEATISVDVNGPSDYVLTDTRTSDFSGTKTDVILITPTKLLASVNTETWSDHFSTRSWDNIQDQIDAGYSIYNQPSKTTGSYLETIDYGGVFNSLTVSITYNYRLVDPTKNVTTVISMATSLDDITYSAFVAGAVQHFTTFRYLRFKLEFTGVDDKALIEVYDVTIRLDVKREHDGGEADILAADAGGGGTTVTFNKDFKDIESIDVTPINTVAAFAIVNFTDTPNPTTFQVIVYDTTFNPIDAEVRWIARGIL